MSDGSLVSTASLSQTCGPPYQRLFDDSPPRIDAITVKHKDYELWTVNIAADDHEGAGIASVSISSADAIHDRPNRRDEVPPFDFVLPAGRWTVLVSDWAGLTAEDSVILSPSHGASACAAPPAVPDCWSYHVVVLVLFVAAGIGRNVTRRRATDVPQA